MNSSVKKKIVHREFAQRMERLAQEQERDRRAVELNDSSTKKCPAEAGQNKFHLEGGQKAGIRKTRRWLYVNQYVIIKR